MEETFIPALCLLISIFVYSTRLQVYWCHTEGKFLFGEHPWLNGKAQVICFRYRELICFYRYLLRKQFNHASALWISMHVYLTAVFYMFPCAGYLFNVGKAASTSVAKQAAKTAMQLKDTMEEKVCPSLCWSLILLDPLKIHSSAPCLPSVNVFMALGPTLVINLHLQIAICFLYWLHW